MTMRTLTVLAAAVALLAACGSSGPADPPPAPPPPAPPSNEVPASATVSTSAYVMYSASLAASDITEPLDVDKVLAPTSETEEPASV